MRTQKLYFERFNSLNFLLRTMCHLDAKKGDEQDAVTHFKGLDLPVISRVWFFATPWTVAHQAPLSMEFSRQEHWSGLPFPPPGDLPDPGIEPTSLLSPALAGRFITTGPPGKPSWELQRTHSLMMKTYTITINMVQLLWSNSRQRFMEMQRKRTFQL